MSQTPNVDVVTLLRALERQSEDNTWRTAQAAREEIERLRDALMSIDAIATRCIGEQVSTIEDELMRIGTKCRAALGYLSTGVHGALTDCRRELEREIERLRTALDKIAERTSSDDPCRALVQIARDALRHNDK